MSDPMVEIDRALRDFAIPATHEDWAAAYVPPQQRASVEATERRNAELVVASIRANLPFEAVHVSVYTGFDDRVILYVYTRTDDERDACAKLADAVKLTVYGAVVDNGIFNEGRTKLKIAIDSKESVDRDFRGAYSLRERAGGDWELTL